MKPLGPVENDPDASGGHVRPQDAPGGHPSVRPQDIRGDPRKKPGGPRRHQEAPEDHRGRQDAPEQHQDTSRRLQEAP